LRSGRRFRTGGSGFEWVTAEERRARPAYNHSMPASRSVIWPLLRPSWTPRVIVARGAIVVCVVSGLGLWIGPRSLGTYVALLGAIAVCIVIGSNLRHRHPPLTRLTKDWM
jgi:hypothetical protein